MTMWSRRPSATATRLNYLYRPSDKHQLSITADWTRFDGTARCEQPNTYYSATNMLVRSDFFYSQPDKAIDIYCAPGGL